jgi:hypothetical protein
VRVAHACAVGRVPVPELKVCLEGTGDERYVLSRLAPTDSVVRGDVVLAQLPHLVELYEEDAVYAAAMVAHITRRLPKTDEPAFVAWVTQAGVDVRPALLGEDPDSRNGATAAAGGASSRVSGSWHTHTPPRGNTRGKTPGNSTGDKADELSLFSFLTRRRGTETRQEDNGESGDVEAGTSGMGMATNDSRSAQHSSAAAPAAATYESSGSFIPPGGQPLHGVAPPHTGAATSSQHHAMHAPHVYTPPHMGNPGHNTMSKQNASPQSPMVPIAPRPPNLQSIQSGLRPGPTKPPLVPPRGGGGGAQGTHMHLYGGYANSGSDLSPHAHTDSADPRLQNSRTPLGVQSPEPPSGWNPPSGVQTAMHSQRLPDRAPNFAPQMQRPASFQHTL